MSTYGLGTFLVLVLAGLAGRGMSQDEQCVVKLQAPEGSSWKAMEVGPRKVPLRKVTKLLEKHDLKLEKGPPPLAAEARVAVACEHVGDMWVALPSLHEDESTLGCWYERLVEIISILIGKIKYKPEQIPGSPPRVYMKNYCGRDLPFTSTSSDSWARMGVQTREMIERLRQILPNP